MKRIVCFVLCMVALCIAPALASDGNTELPGVAGNTELPGVTAVIVVIPFIP